MASGPITSFQIEGGKVEVVTFPLLGGLKSLWMATAATKSEDVCFVAGKMTNLDSVLKSRDDTLPTKVCIIKAMFFSGIMLSCKSWTRKKEEHWKTDAFKPWC